MGFFNFAEKVPRTRRFRLTGCRESAKLPATSGELITFGGTKMTAITTKFQVGAAALAIGATAAFAPVTANAAPAMQVPAAPVQIAGDLPQAPGDFIWFFKVTSVQIAANLTRSATYWTDRSIARYEADLARKPDSIFASYWQSRINTLETRRAAYGQLSLSACRNGQGVSAGPYGTFTSGPC